MSQLIDPMSFALSLFILNPVINDQSTRQYFVSHAYIRNYIE